ncbi:hypothetical protein GCM10025867_25250 [Frondihabitans sucicola]|uniref:Carboxylesterase type B domain-containing protein n=1 Tax=Frondihabitans sucicola TaxID=1268041 RepID=A0ABN6XZ40_9MICO|nr:carboxylesterase family protein [Frondihabitans sucicola]BDZ50284.1 hypothetical protein GCM10025867_25250 [Frondihabitans sucicola]
MPLYRDATGFTLADYPRPSVAVDTAVLTVTPAAELGVLLVRAERSTEGWRLPGTFLHEGERLSDAVLRSLRDKAGVTGLAPRQLHVFDDPDRDERGWVLSVAHLDAVPFPSLPEDSAGTRIAPVASLAEADLPFGHEQIIAAAAEALRTDYAVRPDPSGLLPPEPFTLTQLRRVHEAVAGTPSSETPSAERCFRCFVPSRGCRAAPSASRPSSISPPDRSSPHDPVFAPDRSSRGRGTSAPQQALAGESKRRGMSTSAQSPRTTDTPTETDADLIVDVTGGTVRGFRTGSEAAGSGGIRAWRGIPYAAPPTGDRRFRAPAPVEPWDGIRNATDFGPIAPQTIRRRAQIGPSLTTTDEDCLTLNVQAPTLGPDDERLPVLVFIHGGGYSAGSSRDFSGQGESFVLTGRALYVSFNYRLGSLGYLDFTRYSTAERPIESNLGLRDQVALLEWVQRNIASFGGDPDNVTVFGESAGASAVTTLLGIPAGRGLFARAIAQSSPPSAVFRARLAAEWAGDFVEILRRRASAVDVSNSERDAVDLLLTSDPADLVAACTELQRDSPDAYPGTFCLAPTVDGDFVPEHPMRAIREGRGNDVPLIIGSNAREGAVFRGPLDILPTTAPRIGAMFARAPGSAKQAMLDVYPELGHRRRDARDFGGDYGFWYPSTVLADWHSRHAATYAYRFDFAPRLLRLAGLDATHGVEMFALFDRFDLPLVRTMTSLGGREEYAAAGQRMRLAWLRFATDGTLPASWPAYSEQDRETLIIDSEDRVEQDPRRKRREAWKAFLPVFETLW